MATISGIPQAAQISLSDMVDKCIQIKTGQEVVIFAQVDGLYGGNNFVDQEAISWIQTFVQSRGANPSVLWVDEPAKVHAWRVPPIVKGAISSCDVFINNSFDMEWEDINELKEAIMGRGACMVRNFATTAPLLCSDWAQTPYELVSEIRTQTSLNFKDGLDWVLTDPNGTHLEGIIYSEADPTRPGLTIQSRKRSERPFKYLPWPEWKCAPIKMKNTSGIYIFDRMLSWWANYIGLPPIFDKPITLTLENNRIVKIEGDKESDALRSFMASMEKRIGDAVYMVNTFHYGINPQALVRDDQCPNKIIRSYIDHSNSCNFHIHIGKPPATKEYPYVFHCTADIRKPTLRVGGNLVYDNGHLTTLDDPKVLMIASRYPDRPGLPARY